MKKFNAEGPGNGLFDFTSSGRELDLTMVKAATPRLHVQDTTWDADFLRAPLAASAATETPKTSTFRPYRNAGKRVLDTLAILMALPFALPVIAICAIALWFEGGAPFYTQQRIGRDGKRFSILKLRTMVRNADAVLEEYLANDPKMRAEWDALQKLRNDPRVTPVGGFLRATSLDELPQLFNVLMGHMSLVGPRPMMVDQEEMYGDMRAYEALRPGITGLWQVSARNGNTFSYRNEVDAEYERTLSLPKDVNILFRTVGVVMRRTGC